MEPIGEARVVGLHEVEVHDGIESGMDEARQHLATEVDDIGIEEGDVVDHLLSEEQTHGEPAGAPLGPNLVLSLRAERFREQSDRCSSHPVDRVCIHAQDYAGAVYLADLDEPIDHDFETLTRRAVAKGRM
jgi:hypothetical protein